MAWTVRGCVAADADLGASNVPRLSTGSGYAMV